jgi:riboflavin biosynthesis pyrimidine reductase
MRPFISTNLTISADGKISNAQGRTTPVDNLRLQALRNSTDALMVGRVTWEAEKRTLTAEHQPLRLVISRSGAFDMTHPMFRTHGGMIHLLITGSTAPSVPDGVVVHHGTLEDFLTTLARDQNVKHLHCEGGGELIHALATMDAIDEFHLTWEGNALLGGRSAPTPTGLPGKFLPASRDFELTAFEPSATECFLSYRRRRS